MVALAGAVVATRMAWPGTSSTEPEDRMDECHEYALDSCRRRADPCGPSANDLMDCERFRSCYNDYWQLCIHEGFEEC